MMVWDERTDAQQAGGSARPTAERNRCEQSVAGPATAVKDRFPADLASLQARHESMEEQRRQIAEREGRVVRSVGGFGFARLAAQRRRANTPMFRQDDPEELEQAAYFGRRRGYGGEA